MDEQHNNEDAQLFLTTKEAAQFTGYKQSTLVTLRSRGGGPPFVKVGRNGYSIRYPIIPLHNWMNERGLWSSTTTKVITRSSIKDEEKDKSSCHSKKISKANQTKSRYITTSQSGDHQTHSSDDRSLKKTFSQ